MRDRPSVSSFEPIRLREAVRKLQRQLREMEGERPSETVAVPIEKIRPPGILRRWWRFLFGD